MTAGREPSAKSDEAGVSFAWSVHEALSTWTGRVDTKASIVLTLEVAALGFVIALTDGNKLFASLSGWVQWAFGLGLLLLGLGILCAMGVVFPQVSRRAAKRGWQEGIVFFGHLRFWKPEHLEKHLATLTAADMRRILSSQLVVMAKVAWRKHALLQAAVALGFLAGVAFIVAGLAR